VLNFSVWVRADASATVVSRRGSRRRRLGVRKSSRGARAAVASSRFPEASPPRQPPPRGELSRTGHAIVAHTSS